MPAFPTVTLDRNQVKVRFLEKHLGKGLNQRHLGMPRGVYLGFVPAVTPGSQVLSLNVDAEHGFSLLKVGSVNERMNIDMYSATSILLDFTGHTAWPVYVGASADWQDRQATNARIYTSATLPSGPNQIVLCQVNRVAGDLVIDQTAPARRQRPVAFTGQRYGFMNGGAVGELAAAVSTSAEVIAARTSPYTGAHPTLAERIGDDASGEEMANRLALFHYNLLSNIYTGVSGSSWNVSGSFAATSRATGPGITLGPAGSETTEGAVCAPVDAVRNVCFVVNATTGLRLVDEVSPAPATPSLDMVFGRLTFATGSIGAIKQIVFTNASNDVTGNGTNPFTAPLQQGDIVLAPDGLYYEIAQIVDPNTATLGSAYQGSDALSINATYRRFTLSFHSPTGPYSIPSSRSIQFTIPAFLRLDRNVFDGLYYLKRNGEPPEVQSASTTLAGKVRLAAAGGLIGSIRTAKSNGVEVGNDFHTINLLFGGASPGPPGVVNVNVVGAPGPTGPSPSAGPPGPTGAPGAGYTLNHVFEPSTPFVGPLSGSYTVDFAIVASMTTVDVVTGGISLFNIPSGFFASGLVGPPGISKSGTVGQIDFNLTQPGAELGVWLGACGE